MSRITLHIEAETTKDLLAAASDLCRGYAPTGPLDTVLSLSRHFSAPPFAPGPRFHADGGTTLDRTTGLEWSRENVPGGVMNWAAAKEACRKLTLGGHSDWRLPTIRELLTLVDYERHNPAIDTEAFTCEPACYWTSTPSHGSPSVFAWVVAFNYGEACWGGQCNDSFVRAVRASQS